MSHPVRTDCVAQAWLRGSTTLGSKLARWLGSMAAAMLLCLPATAAVVPNGGFESPALFGGYSYAPANATWTFVGNAGISGNNSGFTSGNPPAPEGVQVGFIQDDGALSQAIALSGGFYVISLKAAQRFNYQIGAQVVQVLVDGVEVGRYQPPGASYTGYTTAPFAVAVGGSHTVTLAGVGSGFDFTAFVDDVQVIGSGGAALTTTSLTSVPNPAGLGVSVTFTATVSGAAPTGTVSFTDNGSPLCPGAPLSIGGNSPTATCTTSTLTTGSHTIVASYAGDGVNAASSSSNYTQVINGGTVATSTSIASSANPAAAGQNVVFTATVTGITPTGTVKFTDGASTICAASPLSGGAGNVRTATCATTGLTVGTHINIVATYSGDGGNAPSASGPFTETINPARASTVTVLSSSANPATTAQAIEFTAQVTGAAPTGTVSFVLDGVNIAGCSGAGAIPLGGTGINTRTAKCSGIIIPVPGAHNVLATYSGDVNNNPSTSATFAQNIGVSGPAGLANSGFELPTMLGDYAYAPPTPGWTFGASAGVAGYKNAFTEGNPVPPEGVQVAFLQNEGSASQPVGLAAGFYVVSFDAAQRCNYQLGTQIVQVLMDGIEVGRFEPPTLAGPTCPYSAYTTPPFTVGASGTHTLMLRGIGGTVYGGSDYTAFVDDVKLAAASGAAFTTTSVTSAPNPANVADSIVFTVTVTGVAPTGSVTLTDNGGPLAGCGAPALSGGGNSPTATCSASLPAGSHTIVAGYGGDSANAASISANYVQVVHGAAVATTTALTSAPNPASAGTNITFTATVTGVGPTGTVTFFDGASIVCLNQPVSGSGNVRTATCATSTLSVGTHATLKATYNGDSSNLASTSGFYTQFVNPALTATITSVSGTPNPAGTSDTIAFVANVTGASPTGTVSFTVDGIGIACLPVNPAPLTGSGNTRSAACNAVIASPGAHSVLATYSGDVNNAGSVSPSYTQNVGSPGAAGVPNGGFELPKLLGDYQYQPEAPNWIFIDSSGIAGWPNAFTEANPPAPEGSQVAFLQNGGAVRQAISLTGGHYVVSFLGAQRCNFHDGIQVVQVLIDGIEVGRFEPPAHFPPFPPGPTLADPNVCPYTSYTTPAFTVPGGIHTLTLKGIGALAFPDPFDPKHGTDFTAFVDDVDIVAVP